MGLIIIVSLLTWNAVLSYEFFSLQSKLDSIDINGETKTIHEVVTNFTTDVTEVVANSISKVVGVSNYIDNELYSTGSGAIYSKEPGKIYIVTNNHVIADANKISVTFANGEVVDATLIGTDSWTDLALLEVIADFQVTPFSLGDSSMVKVGEYVLAIGSPLGLEFQSSVTLGIISGTNRVIPVDLDNDGTDDWDSIVLQTDAAINPGNSGGPLINMAGELIGITSMKIMDTSVEGMGFAIPINEVSPIIDQLKANGEVIRPFFGITANDISEFDVNTKSFYGINFSLDNGLFIWKVEANSPASDAGIQEHDIITSFDGQEITSFKQFRKILYGKKIGDAVEVIYLRDDQSFTTNVTLE